MHFGTKNGSHQLSLNSPHQNEKQLQCDFPESCICNEDAVYVTFGGASGGTGGAGGGVRSAEVKRGGDEREEGDGSCCYSKYELFDPSYYYFHYSIILQNYKL